MMLTDDPSSITPYMDIPLPNLDNERKLRLDPSVNVSKIENWEPSRPMPKTLSELPTRT
jgi:hypothetical protein